MNETITTLFHNSSVIAGEVLSALVLAIIMFAMITYREHRKSSQFLFMAIAIEFLFLLGDAASFYNLSIKTLPLWLMRITYFISYTFGLLVLIPFSLYSKTFIEEKTTVKKWVYLVPIIFCSINFIISAVCIFSGSVYGVVNGKMAETGGAPAIVSLLQFIPIIYLPVVAFIKRKSIGIKAVMLLGLFGILPAVLIFVNYNFTGIGAALALTIVYVLLQCDYSAEREKRKTELEELNKQLTNLNEENVAQIEEITALNSQLEENQSQLEEASAEQEAQLEEITALNAELEERQSQLEEATAEQEAQIEEQNHHLSEIQRLNELFKETQDHAIRNLLDTVINREGNIQLIEELVQIVGEYFKADRAYIFERDATNQYTVNTYEWCAEGVHPEKENLQEVPINVVDPWIAEFRKKGSFYISCDDEYAKKEPMVYEVLEPQGISSLMAAPMVVDGDIFGFIGVDNPRENLEHQLYLSVAATTITHERQIILEKEQEAVYKQELEKSREAAEKANEAKTVFLNNMSHDIRTPMNAILGYASLMKKSLDNKEKLTDYLFKIDTSGEYLLEIINNILDVSRIDSGKTTVDESFTDFEDENCSVIPLLESEIEKKKLEFTCDMNIQHRYAMADMQKIRQITMNLMSNAIKYTPNGGKIHMHFEERPCDIPGFGTYVNEISDTGIGISKEFLETIFDPFTRERNTTESKIGGTGLGMAIVKKLIDLMDGKIEVESELGKGTTFRVILNHRIVENPQDYIDEQKNAIKEDVSFEGKRVLLTEDNDFNAEIAIELLEDAGFTVERAEDGLISIDKLRKSEKGYYDLILMDIQMPNLDGYEATKTIRKLTEEYQANIPIIAMTANAFEEDKQKALEAGMNGHVAKPIKVSELMKVMSENLAGK